MLSVEKSVPIRFSDLDLYNHVTSTRYVDLVEAATLGEQTLSEFRKLSQKRLNIRYLRSIPFMKEVVVHAEVEESLVRFKITSPETGKTFSEGEVLYASAAELSKGAKNFPEAINEKTPIIFQQSVVARFDDLSPANEVPLSKHVDLVVASRWLFLENHAQVTADELVKRGWGFYLTEVTVESHEPIQGCQIVKPRSWLSRIEREGSQLLISFQVPHAEGGKVFSTGQMSFAVMNLGVSPPKRAGMPDWMYSVFYE